ncbi:MAG TPA: tetratricopeptide repeat protein [Candidatus Dormibacteraeota bacterium]|nr:tetratricopeptide repeat protein [Candidatus Dormibacteraeota bacterium]
MGRAARRKQEAAPAAATRSGMPDWLLVVVGPACIVALEWLFYANSFAVPFLFDDYFEIEANPTVQHLAPLTSYLTRSRGLTALTFALNVRQGGMNVWGFHFVNVAIHVANALLVYALVLWTLRLPVFAGRYAPRARVFATLVALVFVAHPLQTMAATYVVQRAESLASFFYLSTLLCAVVAFTASGARRAALAAVALLAAVLGVISKEIVATVPVAVALYWFCFLRTQGGGSTRRWLVLLALLVLPVGLGLFLARDYLMPAMGPVSPLAGPRAWLFIPTAGFQVEGIGSSQYLITQFGVITWYLRLFLIPTGQVFDYGWPFADTIWRADVLLPLACLLALAAAAVLAYRRYRLATFCLGWVFITLAPTSSIIPLRDAAFEHRMYLPIIGLAWLVIVGGADLLAALAARSGQAPRTLWRAAAVAAGVWIAALGVATMQRNEVFADTFRFAEDNARKAPQHWRAQYQLGEALMKRGQPDDAIVAYEDAIRLNPNQGSARIALGTIYLQRRRFDDAERVLEPAARQPEESVVAAAEQNLAVIYQARGDLDRAEEALLRSLELKPQWTSVQRQLAGVYSRKEFWLPAARYYNDALRANPRLKSQIAGPASVANFKAGIQLADERKFVGARKLLTQALDYDPALWRARGYIAYAAAAEGDWTRAESELRRIEREHPGDPWTAGALERVQEGLPIVPPPPA